MWTADEVPAEVADHILERWDQTDPAIQRQTVLKLMLERADMQSQLSKFRSYWLDRRAASASHRDCIGAFIGDLDRLANVVRDS